MSQVPAIEALDGASDANGAQEAVAVGARSVIQGVDPRHYCHEPVIVNDPSTLLGHLLRKLKVEPEHASDDVIDNDVALLWSDSEKRIVTGADLLGRLLRGIATRHV